MSCIRRIDEEEEGRFWRFLRGAKKAEEPSLHFLSMLFILFLLTGCGLRVQEEPFIDMSHLQRVEGVIAEKLDAHSGGYYLLVIPNISKENVLNATSEEILLLAKKNDGAYYYVDPNTSDDLHVGITIAVYWNGDQNDSDPPQRGAEGIEIISK